MICLDTSSVQQECESRRAYEREVWRARCREGRGQANIEVEAAHSRSYSEVRAVSGRGQGGMETINGGRQCPEWRGGKEVILLYVLCGVNLVCCSQRALMTNYP